MSNKQPNQPLGKAPEVSQAAGSGHTVTTVQSAQSLALSMGKQVFDATSRVGEAAAPFIADQAMHGFVDGLNKGFSKNPESIFEGHKLTFDDSLFTFPTGKNAQLSASNKPRPALGAGK